MLGNADAQTNPGMMYELGRGVAQDDEQAPVANLPIMATLARNLPSRCGAKRKAAFATTLRRNTQSTTSACAAAPIRRKLARSGDRRALLSVGVVSRRTRSFPQHPAFAIAPFRYDFRA
jgi:hypothetical protein